MGHKRVKMELIKNERNRIQTFKKRKANLLKKMSEFTILCGVEACLIMFGPTRTHSDPAAAMEEEENELETWPADPQAVRAIIQRYRTSDGPKRTYHLSDYFAEKKKRVDLEVANLNKQIYRHKFPASWDSRLDGFSVDQLTVLLGKLDSKLKLADQKLAGFSLAAAANRSNRLEFDFSQFPPAVPPAVVINSDNNMGFAGDIQKLGFCNDYVEVQHKQYYNRPQLTQQFDHHPPQPQQEQQQQSSFMAMLNANSSEASDEIQYTNLHSHSGLQQLLPDVNSFGGCYSAAEEDLSPKEFSKVGYSIDFELFNHHQVMKPVLDSQMMMMKRFGGYGQDSATYGSFGAASTYMKPWGLDSCGEFGINYSHDWSMMSYMNSPLSSIQQILQQPHQLQFPTTGAGFAAAHYHQGQFSQQVDGGGGDGGSHHAHMTGSSGFNRN
ncbi:unnamed protein product [Linum tenue]|uniref:MADS-box domain-containing protein n=1 Tax=Linum tenue TaxID=586396 RepID=A0AAV0JF58_9ROSI|nr:unnamed protein product [Linum tenue]